MRLSTSPIKYKELYNANRGLPEPRWGGPAVEPKLQCPTCGSTDMCYSAHPDDPAEIFHDNVRCKHCGHITDWYEAFKQRENHPTKNVRKITRS